MVDASDLRRGLATANAVWGNKPSVLVGDFLFSRAFQLMTADGSLDVLRILSDASAVIAEGEVLQLMTANDISSDETAYMQVIEAKTAALFAAACRVGAVVAERPIEEELALERFGSGFGIAFQLVDDVLDYSALQAELGKAVGDDFRDGKITLPVVLSYRRGNKEERAFWERTLKEGQVGEDDLAKAIDLLDEEPAAWQMGNFHTHIGGNLLSGGLSGVARMAEEIARCHHERWDGTGYPEGLKGNQIPLVAQIMAVCDAYDAMISARAYRHARAPYDALEEIARWGILAGATTNPSLLAKEDGDPGEIIRRICDLVGGPTSAEVVSLGSTEAMEESTIAASRTDRAIGWTRPRPRRPAQWV